MKRLGKIDPSSFAESEKIKTIHSVLDWTVDFDQKKISGSVIHKFEVLVDNFSTILLDVFNLTIVNLTLLDGNNEIPIRYVISDFVKNIGSKLSINLPQSVRAHTELLIRINYETSPNAGGLQWLTPQQTLSKTEPFLYSQGQPTYARSMMPCQDTPAIKFTYEATVRYPKQLTAIMGAIHDGTTEDGNWAISQFHQPIKIPSYLIAITVGKLVSKSIGENSCVWAEEELIDLAADDFSETSKILQTAIDICGPYDWGRYDIIVMPPSFPLGGMENPCLTYTTPTVLTGDKSFDDVLDHEISHSWTGNLVTSKNYEHFWLNEGFTVFLEEKIIGRMKGEKERDFHAIRFLTELEENIRTQLANTPELTRLVVDLTNCSPDDSFSLIPYVKGSTFIRYIEQTLGGANVFDPFIKYYIKKYAQQSIDTDDFRNTLYEFFSQPNERQKLDTINWNEWLYGEGMPPVIPKYDYTLAEVSKNLSLLWAQKTTDELKQSTEIYSKITPHQLIDFLAKLIEIEDIKDLSEEKIQLLEKVYGLDTTKNSEARFHFIRLCIRTRLTGRMYEILTFLNSNFRMKFARPIYRDLALWPEAKIIAIENFHRVKDQMMQVCWYTVAKDLGLRQ